MNDQQVLQSSVDAPELQFRVLGPLSATLDGVGLNLGGEKQRTVLAMLLARQGAPVSADALIQAVWGDDAADRAGRTLQTYVSALRSVLGGRIERAGSGWRIEVDRGSVDAEMFEATYERARATLDDDPSHTAEALRAALALWTGHAFADTEAHGELDPEIVRLSELRSAALALRIDADLGAGRDADLIGELETLVAQNPYSERFRAQHMLALYRAGRQQEALRSAREIRELLVEELGVDPTNELQQLEQQILEQDPELDAPGHAAVQTRAVLVVDPGDPFELGHLRSADRDDLLDAIAVAVGSSVGDGPIVRHAAGLTTYLVFQNARQAAEVARRAATTSQGGRLCFAIEHGEVVADEHGVSGAPVARAAALAAAAHPGQVVMSAATQQAIAEDGDVGVRFEALGVHSLRGVEHDVTVYQLLVAPDAASFPPLRTDRAVPPLPASHARAVPGYELREAIGDGSVGLLHRAYQPVAGREVLVEVISRVDAATPQFVQSFEADAQRLSLLDHQNISPVLDHWRQPEGAFVVYRLTSS